MSLTTTSVGVQWRSSFSGGQASAPIYSQSLRLSLVYVQTTYVQHIQPFSFHVCQQYTTKNLNIKICTRAINIARHPQLLVALYCQQKPKPSLNTNQTVGLHRLEGSSEISTNSKSYGLNPLQLGVWIAQTACKHDQSKLILPHPPSQAKQKSKAFNSHPQARCLCTSAIPNQADPNLR